MEEVAELPAAVAVAVAAEEVETAAGDMKSGGKQLTRGSSSDSDEMYSGGSPKGN